MTYGTRKSVEATQFSSITQGRKITSASFPDRTVNNTNSAPPAPPSQSQDIPNRPNESAGQVKGEPVSYDPEKSPWRTKTILSLDGGGVKGYISLLLLECLMEKIKELEEEDRECRSSASPLPRRKRKDDSDAPTFLPSHYFDYIAGTSSGGILAIMLGRLRMSHTECLEAYSELVGNVFGQPRRFHSRKFLFGPKNKFNHIKLENGLKDVVKRYDHRKDPDASFRQPFEAMCRTIAVAVVRSLPSEQIYLFRSYTHAKNPVLGSLAELEKNAGHENTQAIWQIGRATSAAHFHFDTIKLTQHLPEDGNQEIEFVDGGVAAPNPTLSAYWSVRQLYNNAPSVYNPDSQPNRNASDIIEVLVSLGTGMVESKKSKWPIVGKILNEIDSIVAWATDCERTHETVAFTREGRPYFRFNVKRGLGTLSLDSWSGENGRQTRERMCNATNQYLQDPEVQKLILSCAEMLVKKRRARASWHEKHLWEEFCHGVAYRCQVVNCCSGRPTFLSGPSFKDHLTSHHSELASKPALLNQEYAKGKVYDLYLNQPWET